MYPVSDDDLEFLESYLDDALSEEEIQELRSRLTREPELAAALRMLRDERTQRQAYFQTIEPSPSEVEELVADIRYAATKKRWWQDTRRLTRAGSAIAACLAIALLGGFFYHASGKSPLRGDDDASVVNNPAANDGAVNFPVEWRDETGHLIATQHFSNKTDAESFRQDLQRMQERRRQSGGTMLIEAHDF